MKINKSIIKNLNPCSDRFDNYIEHYGNKTFTLNEFLSLDSITYDDKVWVAIRLFTKEQNIKWSVLCVESVLHIFEEKYPEDKRPRLAIEAVKNYINNPNAYTAANAASAYVAANAAANAVDASAYAAAFAAYAAANAAANTAANAAYTAVDVGTTNQQQLDLNLLLMLEV